MNESERLTKLEERYAHLHRHVQEQDKAMLELSERLARVVKELTALRGRVAVEPESGGAPVDERPPHY